MHQCQYEIISKMLMKIICVMKKIPLIQVTQHAALFQRGVTISQITKDHYDF